MIIKPMSQNTFIKDLKTLILRHLDSGSLEIISLINSTKTTLASWIEKLNQHVCSKFGNNHLTKKLNLILAIIWGICCTTLTWCWLFHA
ncbi:hypothetical protein [Candidatus Hodgkinia cicadicola]|uniref:hypothetical protein n=1 Tax=Candidatus Hodgkinia cicadicola TaxID=573658 RepID=UPI0011BA8855